MRSSDSQENERQPGWEDEEGSDDTMEERILIRVKDSPEHLYEQEEDDQS